MPNFFFLFFLFFNSTNYGSNGSEKEKYLSQSVATVCHGVPIESDLFDRSFEFHVSNKGNFDRISEFNNYLEVVLKLIDFYNDQEVVFLNEELSKIRSNFILYNVYERLKFLKNKILNHVRMYLSSSFCNNLKLQFFLKNLILKESSFYIFFSLKLSFGFYNNIDTARIIKDVEFFLKPYIFLPEVYRYIESNILIKNHSLSFNEIFRFDFNISMGGSINSWVFSINHLKLLSEVINDPYVNGIPSLSPDKQKLIYLDNFLSFLQNQISCLRNQIIFFFGFQY